MRADQKDRLSYLFIFFFLLYFVSLSSVDFKLDRFEKSTNLPWADDLLVLTRLEGSTLVSCGANVLVAARRELRDWKPRNWWRSSTGPELGPSSVTARHPQVVSLSLGQLSIAHVLTDPGGASVNDYRQSPKVG